MDIRKITKLTVVSIGRGVTLADARFQAQAWEGDTMVMFSESSVESDAKLAVVEEVVGFMGFDASLPAWS
jgi:hypothetical protein